MDWSGCELVESVPDKLSGTATLKGTRVQADALVENFDSGESVEHIAYNFDLRPEAVQQILAYASAIRTVEHVS